MEADHPTADGLLHFVELVLERLRIFIVEHDIVTVPSEVRIKARPTPGHRQAGMEGKLTVK